MGEKKFSLDSNDYIHLFFIVKFLFCLGSYSPESQKRRLKVVLLKDIKKNYLAIMFKQ